MQIARPTSRICSMHFGYHNKSAKSCFIRPLDCLQRARKQNSQPKKAPKKESRRARKHRRTRPPPRNRLRRTVKRLPRSILPASMVNRDLPRKRRPLPFQPVRPSRIDCIWRAPSAHFVNDGRLTMSSKSTSSERSKRPPTYMAFSILLFVRSGSHGLRWM